MARRKPPTREAQEWISDKIRILLREDPDMSSKQAAAIAYSMARREGFRSVPEAPRRRRNDNPSPSRAVTQIGDVYEYWRNRVETYLAEAIGQLHSSDEYDHYLASVSLFQAGVAFGEGQAALRDRGRHVEFYDELYPAIGRAFNDFHQVIQLWRVAMNIWCGHLTSELSDVESLHWQKPSVSPNHHL